MPLQRTGRPPKPSDQLATERKEIKLTPSEMEELTRVLPPGARLGTWIKEVALAAARAPLDNLPEMPAPSIPVFGIICAGDGLEVQEWIPGAGFQLPDNVRVPDGAYGLLVRGDSMTDPSNPARSIPDSSVALFWPAPVPQPGGVVHVEWQDAAGRSYATLKRLGERPGGGWELVPLNPEHKTLTPDDDSYTIRGVYITRVERSAAK